MTRVWGSTLQCHSSSSPPCQRQRRYLQVTTQHGGSFPQSEQMPLTFLFSLHGNRKKRERDPFTRAGSSTSEMGLHLLWARLLGWLHDPSAPSLLAQRPRPGREAGFCLVMGCPREGFALPVSLLNIAEHTRHRRARAAFLPHGHATQAPGATPHGAFA